MKAKSQEPARTDLAGTRMRLLVLCLLFLAFPGCLPPPSTTLPPVESRQVQTRDPLPEQYQVRANDTLYAIAWRFGLDYRALARINEISPPYLIQVGRILKLRKPPGAPSPPLIQDRKPPKAATNRTSRPQAQTQTPLPPQPPRKSPPAPPREQATSHSLPPPGRWHWPTQGVPVRIDSPVTRSGINIAGRQEQPVWAAAPGKVVYAGDGVLRHGQLILIKHNEELLSAYAHNHKLLIREGQQVQGGEAIAVMGKNPDGKSMLHFEIRRAGQPVDPLRYLRRR